MAISRRSALKGLLVAGTSAAGAAAAAVQPANATTPSDGVRGTGAPGLNNAAVGLLYDATLCIGCKACTVACRDARGLEPDTSGSPAKLYNAPIDLSAKARTVIKLYAEGNVRSFVKAQCMHCVDPACASACMLGALQKREFGIVSYDASLCVGCRYCEVACPFNVPKFQWTSVAPQIVKCELCRERLAIGKQPACTEVCPRKAVVFGQRADLLKEAKQRIAENPGRYVAKVYGETDGGGTQVLYLASVGFEKLGLPVLGDEPAPQLARSIQHAVYRNFAAPLALYGALAFVMWRNRDPRPGETS
jgi:formate dehydrogenase beta subunit